MNRKLVVFVPADALDAVRDALFGAGAGRIGDYERCSWYTEGIGTFRALPGANPAVGEVIGKLLHDGLNAPSAARTASARISSVSRAFNVENSGLVLMV